MASDKDALQQQLTDRRLRFGFFDHWRANRLTFFHQLELTMFGESRSGRNQVAHDHVFLEAAQPVDFARVAASVRTRVVSWNEAAEIKLSVSNEAFVIPSSTGTASAGLPPFSTTFLFSPSKSSLST